MVLVVLPSVHLTSRSSVRPLDFSDFRLLDSHPYSHQLVRPSVSPSVLLFVRPSIRPFIRPSVSSSVRPAVCPSVHPSASQSVRPSVHSSTSSTYPNSSFRQVRPGCDLLSRRHVWIPVALERRLEFLKLLTREVCSLSPLALLLLVGSVSASLAAGTVVCITACSTPASAFTVFDCLCKWHTSISQPLSAYRLKYVLKLTYHSM